jgi:hypothetical protein
MNALVEGVDNKGRLRFAFNRLGTAFTWELRPVFLLLIGSAATFISFTAVRIVVCVGCVVLLTSSTYFSAIVTRIFLLPVLETLTMTKGQIQSKAAIDLKMTKYSALFGALLVVLSHSFVYTNFFIWAVALGPFSTHPWLSPFVFGGNLSSILMGVGVMFISGILKQMSTLKLKNTSFWSANAISHVKPGHVFRLLRDPQHYRGSP